MSNPNTIINAVRREASAMPRMTLLEPDRNWPDLHSAVLVSRGALEQQKKRC